MWDSKTGERLPNAVVPMLAEPRHTTPDGKYFVTTLGSDVLLVATQIDDHELSRRRWLTRPDPRWHVLKRQEFLKEKNVYAAAVHHSWEQHAHGVVAFDNGDFDKAFAHLVAAAVLRPAPPPPPKIEPMPGK